MSPTSPGAVDTVLAEMAQPVLRYLQRFVGDAAIARDLQQETLIRIARGYDSFGARSSVKTWAFAIANRVAADYYRAPAHRMQIVDLDEAEEVASGEAAIDTRLVEEEMNRCVRQVIDSLPDTYRAALILHDLEGLSIEQTALICECTLATAKIRIHRARHRLREALGRQCAFYHDDQGVYRCDRNTPA
ncbi:RNA polymerase sigma factor [Azoarcus olearius]|uniref:RNA polymerase sigma factor SigZ n=1 Tax=Azoarcus sp. (strain BH72) TaxID=418699 RepID=A1K9S3_AZOSB|nr:RNA polymerase sigma factor [Azoarcus olearius]ANQ86125.1 putative RNA polymerase sigma factor SigZ [Azoarcus olearius]CAL95578.1 putative RNA polymerase sigma factor SigZ [Azoarcus olearius]